MTGYYYCWINVHGSPEQTYLVMMLLWRSWSIRNQITRGAKRLSGTLSSLPDELCPATVRNPEHSVHFLMSYAQQLSEIRQHEDASDMKGKVAARTRSAIPSRPQLRWQKPRLRYVKVKTKCRCYFVSTIRAHRFGNRC